MSSKNISPYWIYCWHHIYHACEQPTPRNGLIYDFRHNVHHWRIPLKSLQLL